MADENAVVATGDVTEEVVTPISSEVSTDAAKPDEGGEVEPQETQEQGEQPEHKRKGGWQRKIERLETEREFLMAELLKRSSAPETKQAVETAPKSEGKPNPDDYETNAQYIDACVSYQVAEVLRAESQAKQQESHKSEVQKLEENWNKQITAALANPTKYPDMEEALAVPCVTPALRAELLRSEVPADLAYYLGTHPEEAMAIAKMEPTQMARSLGRIEARFAKEESAETKAPVPPVTKAPKPPTPVSKSGSVPVVAPDDPASATALSDDEWYKARRAQRLAAAQKPRSR